MRTKYPRNRDESIRQNEADCFYQASVNSSRTFNSSFNPTRTPSPVHGVPGNYISPDEDAGLPGTKKVSKRKAWKVVQSHLRRRTTSLFSGKKDTSKTRDYEGEDEKNLESKDVESEAVNDRPLGKGILSTLLHLYDHSSSESSSAIDSTVETPSRPWSDDETDVDDAATQSLSIDDGT